MRVRMIQTMHLTNGVNRYRYDAGKSFHLPVGIAKQYIEQGAAMEDKSIDAAPEVKKRIRKKK